MKQSALVIATLFAAVEANKNHDDARARMQRDIHGYIHNGLKFDTKVSEAIQQNHYNQTGITYEFKDDIRSNIENQH
jgi:hypothetical protein